MALVVGAILVSSAGFVAAAAGPSFWGEENRGTVSEQPAQPTVAVVYNHAEGADHELGDSESGDDQPSDDESSDDDSRASALAKFQEATGRQVMSWDSTNRSWDGNWSYNWSRGNLTCSASGNWTSGNITCTWQGGNWTYGNLTCTWQGGSVSITWDRHNWTKTWTGGAMSCTFSDGTWSWTRETDDGVRPDPEEDA